MIASFDQHFMFNPMINIFEEKKYFCPPVLETVLLSIHKTPHKSGAAQFCLIATLFKS